MKIIKSNNLNKASVKSSPNSQVTTNTVKITFIISFPLRPRRVVRPAHSLPAKPRPACTFAFHSELCTSTPVTLHYYYCTFLSMTSYFPYRQMVGFSWSRYILLIFFVSPVFSIGIINHFYSLS